MANAVTKRGEELDPLFTLQQSSELTKLSVKTLRRRIADGTLEAVRLGPRAIRVRASALQQLEQPLGWAGSRR